MKIALSLFTTLSVISRTMLFLQYQVYSEQETHTDKEFSYSQEIEIMYQRRQFRYSPSF